MSAKSSFKAPAGALKLRDDHEAGQTLLDLLSMLGNDPEEADALNQALQFVGSPLAVKIKPKTPPEPLSV